MLALQTMKSVVSILILYCSVVMCCGQTSLDSLQRETLQEGLLLFRMEKASWVATDILMHNFPSLQKNIEGYLSYVEGSSTRSIFWNDSRKIIFEVKFDSIASESKNFTDKQLRDPSALESDLIDLRQAAFELLNNNVDSFFHFYEYTSPNLIPLIRDQERCVFVITGSAKRELLIGNDYKLIFDNNNHLLSKMPLHNTLIRMKMDEGKKKSSGTFHTHTRADYPIVTSTDICSFLLYRDIFDIYQHTVISDKYFSLFRADLQTLIVLPVGK